MKKLIVALVLAVFIGVAIAIVDVKFLDNTNEVAGIDYFADNNYECLKVEDADFVTYEPKDATPRYGLIFYVGTAIAPSYYDYLGEALAKQGYLMVIPKGSNGFAYMMYTKTELAFDCFPDVEFFVGGHSQGGGAAVRRAEENTQKVKGVVLYAPLCYGKDSIVGSGLRTLLIEAKSDGVLSADMKADAKTRISEDRAEYMIDGAHMSFSAFDDDLTLKMFNDGPASAQVKAKQKELTIEYTLTFMRQTLMRR